jgi:ABC-type transporter Mla subunit MlaD
MKSFTIDPRDRALIRSKLPPELVTLVENSEAKMKADIDDAIKEFRSGIEATLAPLLERDFGVELEKSINQTWSEALGALTGTMDEIKAQVTQINEEHAAAAGRDEELREILAQLELSTRTLDAKLDETRQKLRTVGQKAGQLVTQKISTAINTFKAALS